MVCIKNNVTCLQKLLQLLCCFADTNVAPEDINAALEYLQAKLPHISESYACVCVRTHHFQKKPSNLCAANAHLDKCSKCFFLYAYHSSHVCLDHITESVDSICRDSTDTQYIL